MTNAIAVVKEMQITELYGKLMWGCTTLLLVMFSALKIPYGGLVLAAMLGMIILLYAAQHHMKIGICFTYYHAYMALLACFIAASSVWAIEPAYAVRRVKPLVETLIAMVAIYSCYRDENGADQILKALMWRGYLVLLYIVIRYGYGTIVNMLKNDMRIDSEILNANTIGIMASYSIIINFYYILKRKKIKLLDILIIPAFLILAVSGSRKGLVLAGGGVFAVFILKGWNSKRIAISIIRVLFLVVILCIAGYFVLRLPFMTGILKRMNDLFLLLTGRGGKGQSGFLRFEYFKLGMKLFKEHPIIGIGMDNARLFTLPLYGYDHYLHNNYVELLADGGIVGTAFYYWIYLYLLYSFIKYRKYRDGEYDICFVLMICALVMEYGMVTYESRETYYMLLLFCLEIDKIKEKAKCPGINKNTAAAVG